MSIQHITVSIPYQYLLTPLLNTLQLHLFFIFLFKFIVILWLRYSVWVNSGRSNEKYCANFLLYDFIVWSSQVVNWV